MHRTLIIALLALIAAAVLLAPRAEPTQTVNTAAKADRLDTATVKYDI